MAYSWEWLVRGMLGRNESDERNQRRVVHCTSDVGRRDCSRLVATLGLIFVGISQVRLAARQEEATYYSSLLTKQIEYGAGLLSEVTIVGDGFAQASLGRDRNLFAQEHANSRDEYRRLVNAIELVQIVDPVRIHNVTKNILTVVDMQLRTLGGIAADSQGIMEDENKLKLYQSWIRRGSDRLKTIHDELQGCMNMALMSHTALT